MNCPFVQNCRGSFCSFREKPLLGHLIIITPLMKFEYFVRPSILLDPTS